MGVDPWTLEEVTMDAGLASVWGFHESTEDLKHKLLCATLELEALRANAKEEMRKSEQNIEQLIRLLQVITHERDVAREQLQLVLSKITQPNATGELSPVLSCSVTESDSLSGTPPYGAFDSVGSPEFSSIKMTSNATCNMSIPQQQQQQQSFPVNSQTSPRYDRASAVIDSLVMKKPLPQKGKLLQAVLEAGPTLQTLLLAGPLPQWRNPPPLQPFQVPPVAVKAHNPLLLNQKLVPNPSNLVLSPANVLCHEKSMLSFPSAAAKRPIASPCMRSYENLCVKRQRTQCTGGA